jgi:uncharacterized phage protein (TIGR01671 family)
MSRVIKFRVWKENKFDYLENHTSWSSFWDCNNPEYENIIFQQFTELKDRNHKDIYEGDIVKADPEHISLALTSRENVPLYTKAKVMFFNQGFQICQSYLGRVHMEEFALCDCCPCGLEVIGNVFENPELCEK